MTRAGTIPAPAPAPAIRLIPRIEVKGPNLVKGIQFDGWRVLGLPERFAGLYSAGGADEIILQDVVASLFRRPPRLDVIRRVAAVTTVPLTVAGGIRSVEDVRAVLRAGADKVAINTAAIADPGLLRDAARTFGAQCIVASIEAMRTGRGRYECFVDHGRQQTGIDVLDWARRAIDLGAGEILLTSVEREGTGEGFDLELTAAVSRVAPVPVIASGGAGRPEHVVQAVRDGAADAVAAASLFHFRYAQPVEGPTLHWLSPDLRMGTPVDSGNVDFLNHGYGGLRAILVEPCAIATVKQAMAAAGIPVRPDATDATEATIAWSTP